jgi:hypothetical protein
VRRAPERTAEPLIAPTAAPMSPPASAPTGVPVRAACNLRAGRPGPHHLSARTQCRPEDEVDVIAVVEPDDVHDQPVRRPVGRREFGDAGKLVGRAAIVHAPPSRKST